MRREPATGPDGRTSTRRPKKATEQRNVATNYLAAATAVLVGFLTTPVFTHQLGILRYGVWALIGSLIPFLELLELGFGSATVAFVSRHLELEDDEKVGATLNTSFLILSALGIVAFSGVLVFTIFLPDIVTSIPKSLVGQAQFLLLLLAFDMALSIPMDTFGGALVAMQRFDLLNYTLITVLISQAIAWVIVLVLHGGLVALGIVTVAISLLGQLSRFLLVRHLLPWFRLSPHKFERSLVRRYTQLSGWYSLIQISDAVIDLSDVLIVGAAAGVRAAAVYAVAQRLGLLPVRIVQPRIYPLFTTAGELAARNNDAGIRESTDEVVRFVQYVSVPTAIVLGFLAGPMVEAWVGPLYHEAAAIIGILCVAGVVQGWAFAVRTALSGASRPALPAVLFGIEAVIHIALGLVLASRFGAVGMAEAVLVGVFLMEGVLLLPLAYRQLGDAFPRKLAGAVRTLGLPALVVAGFAWILGRGGGPLISFTYAHGRIAGLAAVALAGLGLMVIFYAVLVISMPVAERQQFLGMSANVLGRLQTRERAETLKISESADDIGRWTRQEPIPDDRAEPPGAAGPRACDGSRMMADTVASARGVESVAQWIGNPERPLFSWLDLPEDGLVAGAAVLCPSMGLESAYSLRALRDLALRLAGSGWAVLRFDYPGTGDSAGEWTDPDLVADWLHSVRVAIDYAQGLGAGRLAVVGLRMGATLAAAELARGGGVDDLVMWDPSVTGRAFLREQRALSVFRRSQAVEWGILREGEEWGSGEVIDDGSLEAPGALYSATTVPDLQSLAIAPDGRLASRELVLHRQGWKRARSLMEREKLPQVEFGEIVGQDALLDVSGVTPEPTLERIVSWLKDAQHGVVRIDRPKGTARTTHRIDGHGGVVERPLDIGTLHLFGMLSEPEQEIDPSAPTVVFLNSGRIPHHGPARLWVDLARSWAADGVRCLRVDLSGIGDSPTRPGRTDGVEFPADALEDLSDVRRALADELDTDIIFVGLCSGGYHAVESALAEPVTAVCLVNPALAFHRWTASPDRRFETAEGIGSDGREAVGRTRPWVPRVMRRLARFQDNLRKVPGGWWILKRLLMTASPARSFDRLTGAGVDVLLVVGNDESRRLVRGEERHYRALDNCGRFSQEVVANLEHSLLERTGRDHVASLLRTHIMRYRAGADGAARRMTDAVGPGTV